MSNVKIVLNSAGVVALLKSNEVAAMLQTVGNEVVERAGDGYKATVATSGDRKKVFVRPATAKARRDNMDNNTLLKALR